MNKSVLFFCALLIFPLVYSKCSKAETLKIAVLDTGYSNNLPDLKVCPNGLKDFTGTGMVDTVGHGTNILGTIAKELKGVDYCVYVFKVYTNTSHNNAPFYMLGLVATYFIDDLSLINYSSSGPDLKIEEILIKLLLKKKITIVAAAGNDAQDLDKKCDVYPACQQGVISVGNLDKDGKKQKMSNYGKRVTVWEKGCNICILNQCFSGTSMSAAIHSSRLIREAAKHGH